MVKGLAPKPLDPLRYHIRPGTDLNALEQGMPWINIQDEFRKYKWIDFQGRIYQGAPYAVEPDATARTVFIASMMRARTQRPVLSEKPDVTWLSDVPDSEQRKKSVHHEEVPGHSKSKKKSSGDKKSTFAIKAKSIPVTPKTVAASTGSAREMDTVYLQRYRTSSRTWR